MKIQNTRKSKHKRVLLIGPKPPPWHGTSVKFETFCSYAIKQLGADLVDVIDTQTGDKAVTSIISISSLRGYVRIIVRSIIIGYKADVIVVFGSQRFATVFGGIATAYFGLMGKSVFISIFGGSYDIYVRQLRPIVFRVVRLIMGRTGGLIVETKHLQKVLVNDLNEKIYYVPNFRNSFSVNPKYSDRNAKLIRFLYVGVIRREKGVGELLEAFGRLVERLQCDDNHQEVTLDLYGPIYDTPNDYVDLDPSMKLNAVRFHGEVAHEQVQKAYADADVFVFPSYWPSEGHSGAVIEALMQGLPVIAADWRAIPELIHHNKNGLLCSKQDVYALTECMERMVFDNELRERLAMGAKQMSSEFDAKNACAVMLDVIIS
jgi:glycosyltransferase involved in cell wall biosynthesis